MTTLFCKDCKHYSHQEHAVHLKPMCTVDLKSKVSLVDARYIDVGKIHPCESNRSTIGWLFGHCGPKAKFFELKEIKE